MNSNKIVRLARNAGFAMNGDKLAMPVGVTIENLLERFYLLATKQGYGALTNEGTKPQQEPVATANAGVETVAEQIAAMVVTWVDGGTMMGTDWRPGLANIIQGRLSRCTTQSQQEPEAWMFQSGGVLKFKWHRYDRPTGEEALKYWKPLYTSPQQRQPLTDDELVSAAYKLLPQMEDFIKEAIEAMEVTGVIIKPDAHQLLADVQAAAHDIGTTISEPRYRG